MKPKELALLVPGGHCPRDFAQRLARLESIFQLERQKLTALFLEKSPLLEGRLTQKDLEEVTPHYQPIIGFAFHHYGVEPVNLEYNKTLFRNAGKLAGPFLHYPESLFLFHDPFESMIDSNMPDKLRAFTFPILDQIHAFSEQFQIPSSRIIYMILEGGDINKIPYDLYYKEHPHLDPVRFIYYPCLEAKTSWAYHHFPPHVSSSNERSRKFVYLNAALRIQRLELCSSLWGRKLLDKDFYWSFLKNKEAIQQDIPSQIPLLRKASPGFLKQIPKILDVVDHGDRYRTLDGKIIWLNPSPNASVAEFFNDTYISLVSETTTGNAPEKEDGTGLHAFLTEKTFKCFYFRHPFIIWGYPNTLKIIRDLGYQTFSPWINEEYDKIEGYYDRMGAVIQEVIRIKGLSLAELQEMRTEMTHILDYNFEHFKIVNIHNRNQRYFRRELNRTVY